MEHVPAQPNLYEIPPIHRPLRASIPAPPSVRRATLTERMNAAADSGFVMLIAPAGWGKSSALADWANQVNRPVAWVSCGEEHQEPTGLLKALARSMDDVGVEISTDVDAMLRSARPMPLPQVMTLLEEDIESSGSDLVLILDDFHIVTSPDVQRIVYDLATTGPGNLAVVVAGRQVPSWPLARLRAHGQLTEFGIRDLAFNEHEIMSLLDLDTNDGQFARELAERSEGWAAGVRLAQLWLRHGGDTTRILQSFGGTHRDIADYLAEEVLETLPDRFKDFLLVTAVPDSISVSLADRITSADDATEMLAAVERQNLFLVPLDDDRMWYRYHAVFRQYLRSRLRQRDPEKEQTILRSISLWYEDDGNLVKAVEYAERAGDADRARALLDAVAEHLLLQRGEAHTLISLTEQLPVDLLDTSFSLKQFYSWALVLVGRLEEAEALVGKPGFAEVEQEAASAGIRARIAAYRGDDNETIAQANIALNGAAPESGWFRADTLLSLGFAYRTIGQTDEALEAFEQAAATGWTSRFAHGALWGTRYQAVTLVSQGRLEDANHLIENGLERARSTGLDRGAALAALLISRGEIQYEKNDLLGAREHLLEALELAQSVGDAKILMNAYMALSMVEQADGRQDRARDNARRAVRVFDGTGEKAQQAWIARMQGDAATVRRWMESYVSRVGSEPDLRIGEAEQTMLARALLEFSAPGEVSRFIEPLLAQSEQSGRWARAMILRTLLAQSAFANGNESDAFMHVGHVIDLASSEGYVRSILDEGPRFLRVVRRWVRAEGSPDQRQFVSRILDIGPDSASTGHQDGISGLAESLTGRQMDVLRLMVEGMQNREIAERLFISEGTVKAHAHQIYEKIMVRSRAEAVRTARELKLV